MATNITKEEDNFLRIVYLNYRVGTTALRRYFDNVLPNLPSDLSSPTNMSILSNLHKPPRGKRRILYQEQWDILYPPSGSQLVSSADLDVTLMVCLLRNLPPQVSQPPNGFDVLPQSSDLSPGAHIARIKCYKNFIVSHSKDGKLPDNDFNAIWIDMEKAILGLGNQQDVVDATYAKTNILDYKALQEQVNHSDNIQQNRKRLNEQKFELAEHLGKIAKLETTLNKHLAKVGDISEKAETACKIAKLETTAENLEKDIENQTVRLIKWYKTIVHNIDIDKTEILDNLKDVLSCEANAEIRSRNISKQQKNREILGQIIRKNNSSANKMFLEVLKEDRCYKEYATKIEETDVTQFDLELLYIGMLINKIVLSYNKST
ncbi:unnamed protein product [Mytilus edulis]|uniref:CARD domain-containing protein n=1 Tax=Mytilus edulis TaxID=6550 RepID=A0A8S3QWK6_MYTED|nr:unnamed protein product [Mytilus edulis]